MNIDIVYFGLTRSFPKFKLSLKYNFFVTGTFHLMLEFFFYVKGFNHEQKSSSRPGLERKKKMFSRAGKLNGIGKETSVTLDSLTTDRWPMKKNNFDDNNPYLSTVTLAVFCEVESFLLLILIFFLCFLLT